MRTVYSFNCYLFQNNNETDRVVNQSAQFENEKKINQHLHNKENHIHLHTLRINSRRK